MGEEDNRKEKVMSGTIKLLELRAGTIFRWPEGNLRHIKTNLTDENGWPICRAIGTAKEYS